MNQNKNNSQQKNLTVVNDKK